jgi:hypothetical protein
MFGYTEGARLVKRSVNIVTAAPRRQWDETSYFADSEANLGQRAGPLRTLYDRLNAEGFGLDWGTGQKAGSFSPKAWDISHSGFLSVFSTGRLTLKLGDLPDQCREKLRSLATGELGPAVTDDQKYPSYNIEDWGNKIDALVNGLVRIVEELRASQAPTSQPGH